LMPDGFIDGFIGMKVGETREFDFDGPKDDAVSADDVEPYHVVATVSDKRRRVVPACIDSFVKKHFSDVASSAAEYRETVRADMQKQVDERAVGQREAMVDDALAHRLQAKIPDMYYEHAQDDILRSLQQQLRHQQMTLEQYIQQQGMQENQFQMMLMMQAVGVLKCGFALDALYRHLDDPIDERDIDAALSQMAPGHEAEARREFDKRDTWFAVREVAERLKAHKHAMATATFEE
jgi:trigger factor